MTPDLHVLVVPRSLDALLTGAGPGLQILLVAVVRLLPGVDQINLIPPPLVKSVTELIKNFLGNRAELPMPFVAWKQNDESLEVMSFIIIVHRTVIMLRNGCDFSAQKELKVYIIRHLVRSH